MSHKQDGPGIGPFASRSVYVDQDSTSATEDGSTAHPYKTIQAALDAMPAPGSALEAAEAWFVLVEAGIYEENLVSPANGFVHIRGTALVKIGTAAAAKTISRTATTGAYTEPNLLKLENISVTGALTLIAGATVENTVEMNDCNVTGALDGSGITTGSTSDLTMRRSTAQAGVDFNGDGFLYDTDISGGATDFVNLIADRTTFAGGLLTVSNRVDRMDECSAAAATITWFVDIKNSTFTGAFTNGSIAGKVFSCKFEGTASFAGANETYIRACQFDDTLTTTGALDRLVGCQVDGVADFAAGLGTAANVEFGSTVEVNDAAANFLNCDINSTFTGPASSYRADGATVEKSSPTLAGGATYVPLDNMLHTAIATTANIVGGAANHEHVDITDILGDRIVIVGVYIKRLTGGCVQAAIQLFEDDAATTAQPIFGIGTAGNGLTVGASFARGPQFDNAGTPYYVVTPYEDADATGEIHMRVYNTDAAGSPGSDGSFEVRVSYYLDTIDLS